MECLMWLSWFLLSNLSIKVPEFQNIRKGSHDLDIFLLILSISSMFSTFFAVPDSWALCCIMLRLQLSVLFWNHFLTINYAPKLSSDHVVLGFYIINFIQDFLGVGDFQQKSLN